MGDPKLPKRILLKLSGEALMGGLDYGIDPDVIRRIAGEISAVRSNYLAAKINQAKDLLLGA